MSKTVIDALLMAEETIDNLVGPEERDDYAPILMLLQRSMDAVDAMDCALQDMVDYIDDPNMPIEELIGRCRSALRKFEEVGDE